MVVGWSKVENAESYTLEIFPSAGWFYIIKIGDKNLSLPFAGVSGAGSGLYQTSVTLRGMTSNTLYTLTIKPFNWVGSGGSTTIKQLTSKFIAQLSRRKISKLKLRFVELPQPINLRVLSETISHNTMSIHWDKVSGADTYEVKVTPPDGIVGAGQGILDTYTVLR